MANLNPMGDRDPDYGRDRHPGWSRNSGRGQDRSPRGREAGRPGRGPRGREAGRAGRGQLLLTAAFVISVLLVSLGLLLNSAIFTANQGVRGTDGDSGHTVVQYRAASVTMTNRTIRHVNRQHNVSHAALTENLSRTIRRWGAVSGRHEAISGGTVTLALEETTNGSRIYQNETRNFTDVSTANNWTLVHGTTEVRRFRLAVQEDELVRLSADEAENASDLVNETVFRVNVTASGAPDRRVFVYYNESAGSVAVAAESSLGTLNGTCHPSGDPEPIVVDLVNATVGGEDCAALEFLDEMSGSRTLRYEYAANVTGTYSLIVDVESATVDPTNYADTASEAPHATDRLNAATVRLTYVTSVVDYRTDLRVVPGDSDD